MVTRGHPVTGHQSHRGRGLASVLIRTFKNTGFLLSGQAVSGLLGLANLAIAARMLGPTDFGVLVLIHTYMMVVNAVARFQSWQALIRYASQALENNRNQEFQKLVVFTTTLDAGSGVLAIVLACVTAPWVGGWLGWSPDVVPYAMVYAFAAPFLMQATPSGVLWLFDRFRLQAVLANVAPGIRLIGSLFLLVAGGELKSFIVVWLVAGVCHGMVLWLAGAGTLMGRDLLPERPFTLRGIQAAYPGIWPYMISTNISSSVKASRDRVAALLVAALLGPAAGGFYRLAQDIAGVLSRAGLMIGQSVFPELSKLHATGSHHVLKRTVAWSGLVGSLASLPFVVLVWSEGEEILHVVGGAEFREAAELLLLLTVGGVVMLLGTSLPSALLAMGAAHRTLAAQAAITALQFAVLWWLVPVLGLSAAGYALLLSNLAYLLILLVMFLHMTRYSSPDLTRV